MNFCHIVKFSLYTLYGAPCDFLRRLAPPNALPGVLEPVTDVVVPRSLLLVP